MHEPYRKPIESIDDNTWVHLRDEIGFTRRDTAAWWYDKLTSVFGGDKTRALREYPIIDEQAFSTSARRFVQAEPKILDPVEVVVLTDKVSIDFYKEIKDATKDGYSQQGYVICADPSGGTGNDHSACVVLDRFDFSLVAAFSSNTIDVVDFARALSRLQIHMRGAYILVETNGVGHGVLATLKKNGNTAIEIKTTASTKALGLAMIKRKIEEGIIYGHPRLAEECNSLVLSDHSGRDEYIGKKDMLMAAGFGCKWIQDNPLPKPKTLIPMNTADRALFALNEQHAKAAQQYAAKQKRVEERVKRNAQARQKQFTIE